MKFHATLIVLAGLLLAPAAFAAPVPTPQSRPPAELSEQAIDMADFAGWRARVDARAAVEAEDPKKQPKRPARERDQAKRPEYPGKTDEPDPFLIRAQILLDRAHASPGAIDGRDGGNFRKAIRAFQEMRGLAVTGEPDAALWAALSVDQGKATRVYEIAREDLKGRFVKKVPKDYAKLARLKWIGFTGPPEMLAERFHLDQALLRKLNPGADLKTAGQRLLVPDVGAEPAARIARIEIDKGLGELRAFGADGALALAAPATVGSDDTPSPEGRMTVEGAFKDPHYGYDPKKNFQQGRNRRKLTLPPGPNGPVGSMWIDLSKPTYGIHGAPEPEKIGKTESHGCVRLTNWDAEALGALVEKGKTVVEFR